MGQANNTPTSSSVLPSNLRNESYYMATNHETWNGSMLQQHMFPNDQDQKDFNLLWLYTDLYIIIVTCFHNRDHPDLKTNFSPTY